MHFLLLLAQARLSLLSRAKRALLIRAETKDARETGLAAGRRHVAHCGQRLKAAGQSLATAQWLRSLREGDREERNRREEKEKSGERKRERREGGGWQRREGREEREW